MHILGGTGNAMKSSEAQHQTEGKEHASTINIGHLSHRLPHHWTSPGTRGGASLNHLRFSFSKCARPWLAIAEQALLTNSKTQRGDAWKCPWRDSNLQSLVSKTDALSIRPQGHLQALSLSSFNPGQCWSR